MNREHAGLDRLIFVFAGWLLATAVWAADEAQLEKGRALAFDRNKGNCLSCHMIAGGELPGNGGPPLIQMKARFPDRQVLRDQIWDSSIRNPQTIMPPYGRHQILSEEELDAVTDYIHSL